MGGGSSVSINAAVAKSSHDELVAALSEVPGSVRLKLTAALSPGTRGTTGVDESGTLVSVKASGFKDIGVNASTDASAPQVSNLVELLEKSSGYDGLKRQTENIVKKCAQCGKVNAYTLLHCNACGTELPSTTETSQNIFTSFIYGVAPFKISIRHQAEDVLVFDDLMQCTPCHFNAIPTTYYIQDWRFLLRRPAEGLKLLDLMYQSCANVFKDSFWTNEGWKNKLYLPSAQGLTADACAQHAKAGFNMPPSQFQLHLQYMVPPFMPYQMQMLAEGKGFLYGRFFPLKYIQAILQKASSGEHIESVTGDTPVDDIIAHFDKLGVSYKDMHAEFVAGVVSSQNAVANWCPEDFDFRLKGGKLYNVTTKELCEGNFQEMLLADKTILQNYGRPYDDAGKPTGVFYKFAKTGRIEEF